MGLELVPPAGMSSGLRWTNVIRVGIERRVWTYQIHTGLIKAVECSDVSPVPRKVPHLVAKIVGIAADRMNQRWKDMAAEVVPRSNRQYSWSDFRRTVFLKTYTPILTRATEGRSGKERGIEGFSSKPVTRRL